MMTNILLFLVMSWLSSSFVGVTVIAAAVTTNTNPELSNSPRHLKTRRHCHSCQLSQCQLAISRILYENAIVGNTEEEICSSYEENVLTLANVDKFKSECSCQVTDVDGNSYAISCIDECYYCQDDACAIYSIETNIEREAMMMDGGGVGDFVSVYDKAYSDYDDDSFDGVKFCVETDFRQGTDNFIDRISINGAACNSVELVECFNDDGTVMDAGAGGSLFDFLVNCTNLGYDEAMHFCNASNLEGPFLHYVNFDFEAVKADCPSSGSNNHRHGMLSTILGGTFMSLVAVSFFTLI